MTITRSRSVIGGDSIALQGDAIARNLPTHVSNGRVTKANLLFDINRDWYIDPTPGQDEEFNLSQTLFEGTDGSDYAGDPPELLEVGYRGKATTSAAQGRFDLLTTAMHELGHALGIPPMQPTIGQPVPDLDRETLDGDYDFISSMVGGRSAGVIAASGVDFLNITIPDHIAPAQALMAPGHGQGVRVLPGATDALAAARTHRYSQIDLLRKDMLGGTQWNVSGNWIGNRVPDADDSVHVRTGNRVNVANPAEVDALTITRLSEVAIDGSILNADHLELTASGDLSGHGSVRVTDLLFNSGQIAASDDQTLYLQVDRINLDGTDQSGLRGDIEALDGNVEVLGPTTGASPTMTDPFGGSIVVGPNRDFTFHNHWTLGTNGRVLFNGGTNIGDEAWLQQQAGSGIELTVNGDLTIHGRAALGGTTDLTGDGSVLITGNDDRLRVQHLKLADGSEIDGDGTLVQAGQLTVASGNTSTVNSALTVIRGASATVGGDLVLEGVTELAGGHISGSGSMHQNNDLHVTGDATVDVALLSYDWNTDGDEADTIIYANRTLTINAAVSGTEFVQGQPAIVLRDGATLNTNLPFGNRAWRVGGAMELHNGTIVTNADALKLGEDGVIRGDGVVEITANGQLSNSGVIRPQHGSLVLQGGNDAVDLDGRLNGGQVNATAGDLVVNADLADAFLGTIYIGAGHKVQFGDGWSLGDNDSRGGTVKLNGGATPDDGQA